jgi:O-antigen/teichoic acid export membrane protein
MTSGTDSVITRRQELRDRIARWKQVLRVQPFETSTPEGRSAERYRRIAWSTVLAVIARVVLVAVTFISVPLVVGYLGAERYGMWLTISSLLAVLGPLDLGVGNGLRQMVAEASGRDDGEASRRAISSALILLSAIALVVVVAVPLVYPSVSWAALFNVSSTQAQAEAGPATVTLALIFAVGLPLSVVGVVQSAYQSAYVTSLWAILGTGASLLLLLVAINAHAGLPVLIAALTGAGLIAALLNSLNFFGRQRPALAPRLHDFGSRAARSLLGTGFLFVVLQLAGLLAYQLDNFIIARVMGAEAVQQYAIPMKLFSLAPLLVSFALVPLWPAYREAIVRGEPGWVRRTLRRSLRVSLLINVPAALLLVVVGSPVLSLWVGDAVSPTPFLLIGLGAWAVIYSVSTALAMLLNAANVIRFQIVFAVLMAVANLVTSVFLVMQIGVAGAVYGSIIAQVLFVLIPFAWYIPRLLNRLDAGAARTSA